MAKLIPFTPLTALLVQAACAPVAGDAGAESAVLETSTADNERWLSGHSELILIQSDELRELLSGQCLERDASRTELLNSVSSTECYADDGSLSAFSNFGQDNGQYSIYSNQVCTRLDSEDVTQCFQFYRDSSMNISRIYERSKSFIEPVLLSRGPSDDR